MAEEENNKKDDNKAPPPDNNNIENLPEWGQKHIKELREESKGRRLKIAEMEKLVETQKTEIAKQKEEILQIQAGIKKLTGAETEDNKGKETPENDTQKLLESLVAKTQQMEEERFLRDLFTNTKYQNKTLTIFVFKLQQAYENLPEGQEDVSEETLLEIQKEIHKRCRIEKGPANSSVGGGPPKNDDKVDTITYEEFLKMGIFRRQDLYEKNPNLYKQYVTKAKEKNELT